MSDINNNNFDNFNYDNTLFNENYDIYNNYNNNYYENKPKYNIDLFTGVKEEFEKDKNSKNNIYLDFYNKNTKKKVLQDFTEMNKKYYDINMEQIKEKEYKYKKKKEIEEKIKKRKEKEDTNEYRKQQMLKLYSNELTKYNKILNTNNKYLNIKPKIYNSVNNNSKNKNIKNNPKIEKKESKKILKTELIKKRDFSCPKKIIPNKYKYSNNSINNSNNYRIPYNENKREKSSKIFMNQKNNKNNTKVIPKGSIILMTKKEYDKTIKELKEKAKTYINELDILKSNGKTIQAFERQIELGQLIDKIRKDIDKYQLKVGIKLVDN